MTNAPRVDPETLSVASLPHKVRLTGLLRRRAIEHVAARYAQGAAVRAIATELNRGYGTTHRLLTEGKVEMRSRGGVRLRGRYPSHL